ncbi:MAG: sugar phosphate isomerase/epimerase [Acidothermus cellulolyticus]|nr:sugar phosphate isomerase/epimerase [Acidothermus cellulolyticus]
MKLGVYTACLHHRPLSEALDVIRELGLDSAEINSGGFLPTPHLPVRKLLGSQSARDDYLDAFHSRGLTLTALNCNGNPLHPDPEVREKHAADLRRSIEVAAALGVRRVVTMSGLPASDPGGRLPSWTVVPWDSAYLDVRDYQWNDIAIPFWREIDRLARDHDVRVCIEMHPHNIVYNPVTLVRLVDAIDATHVGAEMDPSHLFWQGIDPVVAVRFLGTLVYNAAAKDTRINAKVNLYGVLDDRFDRIAPDAPKVSLGGRYVLNRWPDDAAWDFVAVGRGHDTGWWHEFLRALAEVDPDMAVNIEHEDRELDSMTGLRIAAETLRIAAKP